MAKLQGTTISRRTVEALKADRDTVFWDSELLGFGVRVYPTGRKVYVVQTRAGGKDGKRVTVGRHGVISAEEARRRAALIVARIKGRRGAGARADGGDAGERANRWRTWRRSISTRWSRCA